MDVAIVGAGMSGIATGLALQRAGVPFTIFEKADEVGGTWRDNRYPGLTIDVPSYIYTYATDRHAGWRRWMPAGAEILDYFRDVTRRNGLYERIRFGAEVVAAEWTGTEWAVRTGDGEHHRARVLVCASGFLHHPHVPAIPGLEDFAGDWMHSARWDDRVQTAGRRVGIVGSGSTGVQLVTELAGTAAHVTAFQRTPQWVFPVPNFSIPPRVQRWLERHPDRLDRTAIGLEWFADWFVGGATIRPGARRAFFDLVARAHLRTVRDRELRRRLTPADAPLCKRPVVSGRYYRAVQRPDVTVTTERVDRVVPEGIRTADGVTHPLDVLVLATGFRAHDYMRPMRVTGRDGRTLEAAWADGPLAYRTVGLAGFPNLFLVLGPHSPLVSFPLHASAELQSAYVVQLLDVLRRDGVVAVEPTADATARWRASLVEGIPGTVWATGCASWYLGDGDVPVLWPYDRARWRALFAEPELADYTVHTAAPEPVAG